jgi:hypothetical protein
MDPIEPLLSLVKKKASKMMSTVSPTPAVPGPHAHGLESIHGPSPAVPGSHIHESSQLRSPEGPGKQADIPGPE